MTRLLLAGCGRIATAAHLPALQLLQREGLVDVAVTDVDQAKAEAAASQFGFRMLPDWECGLRDGVDAAVVCVPPGPNVDLALSALDVGCHVLIEKPPARTAQDAGRLAAAAASHRGVVTMVGFNRRWMPLYEKAIGHSTAISPPNSFYGRFSRPSLNNVPSNTAADWLTSDSVHALDLAVATVGFPHAASVDRRVIGRGPDNVWTIQLHSAGGAAVMLFNYSAGQRMERYEWAGVGYDVVLEPPETAIWSRAGRPPQVWEATDLCSTAETAHIFGFVSEYRAFLSAVDGEGPPPSTDFAHGARVMGLVEDLLTAPSGTVVPVHDRRSEIPPPVIDVRTAEATEGVAPSSAASRTARPRVVVTHQPKSAHRFFDDERMAGLRKLADVGVWDGRAESLRAARVIITGRGGAMPSPEALEQATDLELVVALGASVRQLDPERLMARGVRVCNTADAVAQSVAEHCLLLTLAGLRLLPQHDRALHQGAWPRPRRAGTEPAARVQALVKRSIRSAQVRSRLAVLRSRVRGRRGPGVPAIGRHDLRGALVGLVGWGSVARHFAALLQPFEVDLLVVSDSADPAELAGRGARRASMGEVFSSCHIVSLHKGLTEETRGLIGSEQLDLLRRGAVFVNTARGELVEERALVERLEKGDIIAALDVFAEEPLPKRHPLRRLPNAILTPHHASSTMQEDRRMGAQALDTVLAYLEDGEVRSLGADQLVKMS